MSPGDDTADIVSLLEGRRITADGHANGKRHEEPALARIPKVIGDHLNAERFLDVYGEVVRYSAELGHWLIWNGSHWEEDRTESVQEFARLAIDGLRASYVGEEGISEDEWKRRAAHYKESTRSTRRDGLLITARTRRSVAVKPDDLDKHRHLLACANGTVNLRTGELHDADPDDLLTRGTVLEYDPEARSDEWERFLAMVFAGDTELTAFVRRLFGYAATGETSEHILPILWGSGANGKSTFITAVMTALGDQASVAPEGLLTETHQDKHPERIAVLRGRRLVVSSELEQRSVLAEGLVKQLTGADKLTGRHLHRDRFDFVPTHTMVLVTNHTPRVRGTDEAIWRRLRMVPFTVTIPPHERVAGYGEQLAYRNGEAILAWLISGAGEWYRDGLGTAERVQQATFEYRQREDVFANFLDECTVQVDGRTAVKDLQARWRDWAKTNGCAVGRTQDFSDWLVSHNVVLETTRGARFAKGLGILTENHVDQEDATPRNPSGQMPLVRAHEGDLAPEVARGREQQVMGDSDDDRESQPW